MPPSQIQPNARDTMLPKLVIAFANTLITGLVVVLQAYLPHLINGGPSDAMRFFANLVQFAGTGASIWAWMIVIECYLKSRPVIIKDSI